jgi:hypothetical protein
MECRLAGETVVLGENLPQRHFSPSQNPTWPDPGLNPGRRGGKPATNRLSYGAADFTLSVRHVRFQVLTVVAMKNAILWDLTLCSLVEVYRPFGGTRCPYLYQAYNFHCLVFDPEDEGMSVDFSQTSRRHIPDVVFFRLQWFIRVIRKAVIFFILLILIKRLKKTGTCKLSSGIWNRAVRRWRQQNLQKRRGSFLTDYTVSHSRRHNLYFLLLLLLFGLWGYWHCGHSWPIVPASGDSEDDCGEADGM